MNRSAQLLVVLGGACVLFVAAPAACGQPDPPAAKEPVAHGKPLQFWIDALKDSEALVREEAVLVLIDFGPAAKNAVPALTPLLKDASVPLRVKAATALVRIDPRQAKNAVPVLCEALKIGTPAERVQTVQLLGQLGADAGDACPMLVEAMNDPDASLRSAARGALTRIGAAAVPPLKAALTHKDVWVRRSAAETLGPMGSVAKDAAAALKERLKDDDALTRVAAAQALFAIDGQADALVPVLGDALKDKEPSVRRAGALVLFQMQPRPKEALPIFTAGLKDADPRIRIQSARAVWETNHKADEVMPVLVAVIKNPKEHALALDQTLSLVAQIGPPARVAIPPLVDWLKTADPALDGGNVADALGAIGAAAVPPLAELLADKDTAPHVQRRVLRALGAAGPEGAAELVRVLEKGNAALRPEAVRILGQMGPAGVGALPRLLEMAKSTEADQRFNAVYTFYMLGPEARPAAPLLVAALKDTNAQAAGYAVQAFRTVQPDPKTTVPALRDALKEATPQQRNSIADAMVSVDPTDKTVLPTLLEMLEDKVWSGVAANHLGRMGPHAKDAVPALVKVIQTAGHPGRLPALFALQRIGPEAKAAVPDLLELVRTEKDVNVRFNVVLVLKAVGADSKETVAAMGGILEGKGSDLVSPLPALDVLAGCGKEAKDAAPTLADMLKHTDPQVRLHAATALVKVDSEQAKDKAVPVLEELLSQGPSLRGPVIAALLNVDPDNRAALDAARALLDDPLDNNRLIALDALGQAGPDAKKGLAEVREALKNPAPFIRSRAALTLWKIDKQHKDEAVAVLIALLKQKDLLYQRNGAAALLGTLGADAKKALPALLEARKDRDFGLRLAANEAIKLIDPEAFARIGVPETK